MPFPGVTGHRHTRDAKLKSKPTGGSVVGSTDVRLEKRHVEVEVLPPGALAIYEAAAG